MVLTNANKQKMINTNATKSYEKFLSLQEIGAMPPPVNESFIYIEICTTNKVGDHR